MVFTLVADAARAGLIESLARPGGHATGLTNFEFSIGGKWLELLRTISPHLNRVTVIANPANATANPLARIIEDGARLVSIEVTTASVYSASDIETAISSTAEQSGSGLIVLPDSLAVVHSELIVSHAAHHHLPAVYPFRLFAAKGGLLTTVSTFRRCIDKQRIMLTVFCEAPNRQTCPSRHRTSSSWSSTSRPPRRLA